MKFIISLVLVLILAPAAFAQFDFKPYWESFGNIRAARYGKVAELPFGIGGLGTNKRQIVLRTEGMNASCGMGPFFTKYRSKVLDCSPNQLTIELEYFRTDACDQASLVPKKIFRIELPKGCDFQLEAGSEILLAHDRWTRSYPVVDLLD